MKYSSGCDDAGFCGGSMAMFDGSSELRAEWREGLVFMCDGMNDGCVFTKIYAANWIVGPIKLPVI